MTIRNTTAVPNALLDSFLSVLKPAELKVLLVIIRSTIGWHKEHDWISTSQFMKKTGLSRKAIYHAIERLLGRGLIAVTDHPNGAIEQKV